MFISPYFLLIFVPRIVIFDFESGKSMGAIKSVHDVILIAAICHQHHFAIDPVLQALVEVFGPVATRSQPFPFSHTRYYQDEMGGDLDKFYLSFQTRIDPARLPDCKIISNRIEQTYTRQSRRLVSARSPVRNRAPPFTSGAGRVGSVMLEDDSSQGRASIPIQAHFPLH